MTISTHGKSSPLLATLVHIRILHFPSLNWFKASSLLGCQNSSLKKLWQHWINLKQERINQRTKIKKERWEGITNTLKRSKNLTVHASFKLTNSTWVILPLIEMALSPRFRRNRAIKRVAPHVRVKTIVENPRFSLKTYTSWQSCENNE